MHSLGALAAWKRSSACEGWGGYEASAGSAAGAVDDVRPKISLSWKVWLPIWAEAIAAS
jgi:hypothetical protein